MRFQGSHLINYETPPLFLSSFTPPLFFTHINLWTCLSSGISRNGDVNLFKVIPVNIILAALVSRMGVHGAINLAPGKPHQ